MASRGKRAARPRTYLLFLWQRISAQRLEVFGDAALLDRYFELAPPD